LGDGFISAGGVREKGVWALRIMCADGWPGLLAECKRAMGAVRPGNKPGDKPGNQPGNKSGDKPGKPGDAAT